MKSIALFNNKGGVGKTTFLMHLGFALEKEGKKVLFVDLDPQCNLSSYIMSEEEISEKIKSKNTIYHAVQPLMSGTGDVNLTDPIEPYKKDGRNIWVLTGDISLSEFEEILSEAWVNALAGRERGFRVVSSLYRLINQVSTLKDVDYVLIDIGPNLGSLNRTAILGCDYFFIPVIPDLFSIRGLENIGTTFTRWIKDWAERYEKNKEQLNFPIQKGKPTFSGYINQNFNIYREDKTKTWTHWSQIIPRKIRDEIAIPFGKIDASLVKDLNDGSFLLGDFKNYHSLAPLSQKLYKPIFELSGNDEGMNYGWNPTIKKCKKEFQEIAQKVIRNL